MYFCAFYFSLSFFFCGFAGKESSMNTGAIENFISLPSGSGYFIFRSPWNILTCFFVLFFLKQYPNIHRSVLGKIKIDLLYFWQVYDVNLWKKNFGRHRAYLLFMQNKESLHNFIILRKKQWTQMMTKKLKQSVLNQ